MKSFWTPRHWKKIRLYFGALIFVILMIGRLLNEDHAAFSVVYGGLVSFIYLLLLVLTAKSYGDKIHLFLQILSGLRLPVTAFALALSYVAPMLELGWTLAGFFVFYPLVFLCFQKKWE